MARVKTISIRGFRSIRDVCVVECPEKSPLILIGENNAGKSNIVRALDVVLGEYWPGNREVLDHDCWGRDLNAGSIDIDIYTSGLTDPKHGDIERFSWSYRAADITFGAYKTNGEYVRYISNPLRQKCQAIVVSADRRLSYQLSYTSKATLLSKLMRRFHAQLVADAARVVRLKAEFANVVAIFGEVAEFKRFQEGLIEQLGAALKGMTYGLSVDASAYDPSNFFHSLRLLPTESGEARTFEELGTGQEQILALVFAHAYARAFYEGLVLVIEEPEAHLHPLAQQWLARTVHAMAADGLQLVITTHSPAFVDMLGLEGIVVVRKVEGATCIRQLKASELAEYCTDHGSDPERTAANTILPFYASATTPEIAAGLFGRAVVLVEGPTEAAALPVLLMKAGLDTLLHGVAIVPVMGKGNLARWWRFFTAFEFPVYVIFDNDGEDDKKGAKREDVLRTIGVPRHDIAGILETSDWVITPTYVVFGVDFETTLRGQFADYKGLEDAAREELGESKPLVAKYVADHLNFEAESGGRTNLKVLAEHILHLLGAAAEAAPA